MKRFLAILCLVFFGMGCNGINKDGTNKSWQIRPFFKVGHGQHARSHVIDVEVGTYGYYGISKWGLGWTPTVTASNHRDPWFGMPYPGAFMLSWEMRE